MPCSVVRAVGGILKENFSRHSFPLSRQADKHARARRRHASTSAIIEYWSVCTFITCMHVHTDTQTHRQSLLPYRDRRRSNAGSALRPSRRGLYCSCAAGPAGRLNVSCRGVSEMNVAAARRSCPVEGRQGLSQAQDKDGQAAWPVGWQAGWYRPLVVFGDSVAELHSTGLQFARPATTCADLTDTLSR